RQQRRAPGQAEAEHVGQVVAGVGHQRGRVGDEAVHEFDGDEGRVQADRDREGAAVAVRRRMVVVMAMIVAVMVMLTHASSPLLGSGSAICSNMLASRLLMWASAAA